MYENSSSVSITWLYTYNFTYWNIEIKAFERPSVPPPVEEEDSVIHMGRSPDASLKLSYMSTKASIFCGLRNPSAVLSSSSVIEYLRVFVI